MPSLLPSLRSACRRPAAWLLTLGMSVLLSGQAFAQQPAGTITGTVIDQSGAVVAGAAVTIVESATQVTRRLTTSRAGTFTAPNLPPGRYDVRVEAAGFKQWRTARDVLVGRVTVVGVRLEVGRLAEFVTVSAAAIRVNPAQVVLDGVVTERFIRELPLNGRNSLDPGQLEPGVQATRDDNPTRGAFARLSLNGQTGVTTRVTVDGLDIADEHAGSVALNLSIDAIREFQLSRALFDVSTGLSGSGAVNIVTKAGTNEWHGDTFLFWRGGRAAAPNGQPATPFDREQAGASAGGRLVRNRLFAFASYERNNQDATVKTTFSQFPQFSKVWRSPFDEHMATSRLDGNLTQSVRALVRGTYDWNEGIAGRSLGALKLAPLEASNRAVQVAGGMDAALGRFTHSVRLGNTRSRLATDLALDRFPEIPQILRTIDPAGRLVTIQQAGALDSNTIVIGAHPVGTNRRDQATYEVRYDGGASLGAHAIRWGADVNLIRVYWSSPVNLSGPEFNLRFDLGPVTGCGGGESDILCYRANNVAVGNGLGVYTDVPSHGHPYGGAENNRVHLYAGDSWRLHPRLTATFGLRWVYEPGAADPERRRPAILETFRPGLARPERPDLDNFAPQAGVAWSPSASGRWVVRTGAGVFYDVNRLQNVMYGEGTNLLPVGITGDFQTRTIRDPLDPSRVFFTLAGTPALGTPGLIDAVFAAEKKYRTAVQGAGATVQTNLTKCDIDRQCTVLAAGYQTPYSRHYTIGVQRELRADLVLSVDYVRNDSVHFMMRHNANRNGAADKLNVPNARRAMTATHDALGCGQDPDPVQCAINQKATISAYVTNGLGSSATPNAPAPGPSDAAFPGFDPNFRSMGLLEMNGYSTYNALQVNLRGTLPSAGRILKQPFVVASYTLSRLAGTAEDQAALWVTDRVNNDDPTAFRGPTSLDRTHMLTVAAMATLPGDVKINVISKAFSALPQTLFVPTTFGGGSEIFATDFNGDGTSSDPLPGTNRGSYGRGIGCGAAAINGVIDAYNKAHEGQLTPAGRRLVNEGLFTEKQLQDLGATSPRVEPAPDGQVCLGAFFSTDMRIARSFRLRGGRVTVEPALEVFNVFNVANYDLPDNKLSGILDHSVGSANYTTAANRPNRAGVTGSFAPGAPRSWQLMLRVSF